MPKQASCVNNVYRSLHGIFVINQSSGWKWVVICLKKINHLVDRVGEQYLGFTDPLVGSHQDFRDCRHFKHFVQFRWSVCWLLIEHLKAIIQKLTWQSYGQNQMIWTSVATFRSYRKWDFEFNVFAEVKEGWPIAKSIRNLVLMLMAVFKHANRSKWASRVLSIKRKVSLWFSIRPKNTFLCDSRRAPRAGVWGDGGWA